MKTTWAFLGALAGLGFVTLQSSPAAACETDEECGAGYVCETYETSAPCPIAVEPCADGDEACIADQDAILRDCEPETYTDSYCRRATCEADSDCGDLMVCLEHTSESCAGGGAVECDADGNCTSYDYTEECTTEVYKECGYRYEGECQEDADCGDGFTCAAQESCYCTGGTPVAGSDGGVSAGGGPAVDVAPPSGFGAAAGTSAPAVGTGGTMSNAVDPVSNGAATSVGTGGTTSNGELPVSSGAATSVGTGGSPGYGGAPGVGGAVSTAGSGGTPSDVTCQCVPSEQKSCQVKELPCASDSECPAGLACQLYGGQTCTVNELGEITCVDVASEGRCQPREWVTPVGVGSGTMETGGSSGTAIDDGAPSDNVDPPVDTEAGWGDDGSATPSGDDDATSDDGSAGSTQSTRHHRRHQFGTPLIPWAQFGCSVSHEESSSGAAAGIFGLAGLALLAGRRRRG